MLKLKQPRVTTKIRKNCYYIIKNVLLFICLSHRKIHVQQKSFRTRTFKSTFHGKRIVMEKILWLSDSITTNNHHLPHYHFLKLNNSISQFEQQKRLTSISTIPLYAHYHQFFAKEKACMESFHNQHFRYFLKVSFHAHFSPHSTT